MAQRSIPPAPSLCGEQISSVMVGHLVTRLEVEANKNQGHLSAVEIRALAEAFLAEELPRFQATFQRNYDECTLRREEQSWSGVRKHPFDRILTKQFADLFPARKGDDGGQGLLSRRVIPGFILAINKMIGPMLYEQCQNKTRGIMDRHATTPGNYDWDAIYADPDSQSLTNDVLVVVAHYFADFDKRRGWFMDMVNSKLSRPTDEDKSQPNWTLTSHGFAELMRTLFVHLEKTLATAPERLRSRYGDHTIGALTALLDRLRIEL